MHAALLCPYGVATVTWLLLLLCVIAVDDVQQLVARGLHPV